MKAMEMGCFRPLDWAISSTKGLNSFPEASNVERCISG